MFRFLEDRDDDCSNEKPVSLSPFDRYSSCPFREQPANLPSGFLSRFSIKYVTDESGQQAAVMEGFPLHINIWNHLNVLSIISLSMVCKDLHHLHHKLMQLEKESVTAEFSPDIYVESNFWAFVRMKSILNNTLPLVPTTSFYDHLLAQGWFCREPPSYDWRKRHYALRVVGPKYASNDAISATFPYYHSTTKPFDNDESLELVDFIENCADYGENRPIHSKLDGPGVHHEHRFAFLTEIEVPLWIVPKSSVSDHDPYPFFQEVLEEFTQVAIGASECLLLHQYGA